MSVTLKNIYLSRGSFAIRDLSLTIEKGSVTAIMGPSGCGKTTLLEIMTALTEPDSGTLFYDGNQLSIQDIRSRSGILFQYSDKQLFASTLWEDIAFGIRRSVKSKTERKEKALELMELTGLPSSLAEAFPLTMSGGEKRKAALAGVLIREPEYLFLDEPLSGLDPESREAIMKLISSLKSEGRTIVYVTHSAESAAGADRLLVMKDGAISFDGRPEKVLSSDEEARSYGIEATHAGHLGSLIRAKGIDLPLTTDTDRLLDEIAERFGGAR